MKQTRFLLVWFGIAIAAFFVLSHSALAQVLRQQTTPPLALSAQAGSSVIAGEMLTLTVSLSHVGEQPLAGVQVSAVISGLVDLRSVQMGDPQANLLWDVSAARPTNGLQVFWDAQGNMVAGQRAEFNLILMVRPDAQVVTLVYTVTARGFALPVVGAALVLPVSPPATPTPTPGPTPAPPTATLRPTATVTVALAELPPTPTPKLTSRQEELGTLSVMVFVVLALIIALAAVIWMMRSRREK